MTKLRQSNLICILLFLWYPSLNAQTLPYDWNNVAVGGAGYVLNHLTHPLNSDLQYIGSDVAGLFRWVPETQSWKPLMDWISPEESNLYGIDGFTLDANDPDLIYACLGKYNCGNGGIYKSSDRGETWTEVYDTKFSANRTLRIVQSCIDVDDNNSDIIYCGTRTEGLVRSSDAGNTWTKVSSVPLGHLGDASSCWWVDNAEGIRNVAIDPSETIDGKSSRIYVGIPRDGIYWSNDGGANFEYLIGSPSDVRVMVPSKGILYVSTNTGLLKYNGNNWQDITPADFSGATFNGIDVDANNPDRVICTTAWPSFWNEHFRSTDGGQTWEALTQPQKSLPIYEVPWYRPGFYNSAPFRAGASSIHFDPQDPNVVYATDWYSVYKTSNFWEAQPVWNQRVKDYEATVPLTTMTPPSGASFFSGFADFAGFRHLDVSSYQERIYDVAECTGMDYQEADPDNIAILVSDSHDGANTRFLTSSDNGVSFTEKQIPEGARSGKLSIARNDANNIVYVPGGDQIPYYTTDGGNSWTPSSGAPEGTIRKSYIFDFEHPIIADRTRDNTFYLYSYAQGILYRSTDGGENFSRLSDTVLPLITDPGEYSYLRQGFSAFSQDIFWISLSSQGLWYSTDGGINFTQSSFFSYAYSCALGVEIGESLYPTLFVYGKKASSGEWAIWRSTDNGQTWQRTNRLDNLMGNEPTVLDADRQIPGRVYTGTNGRGIFYGEWLEGNTSDPISKGNTSDSISDCSYLVRAKLVQGSLGVLELRVDDETVKTWVIDSESSSNYSDFTYTGACGDNIKVYFQDDGADVVIDYLEVNGTRYESEAQEVNTGVWQGQCGGSYSEYLQCAGYIEYKTDSEPEPEPEPQPEPTPISTSAPCSYLVKAKLIYGSTDLIELRINDETVKTWVVDSESSSNYSDFTYTGACGGNVKVYFQDNGGADVAIDYLEVNGTRYESEAQVVNTGVWQGQCGGSYSESIHCAGYIEYAIDPGTTPDPTQDGQAAYVSHSIPGTIQAENYDMGGEGIAYQDSDPENEGNDYRSEGVDIQATSDNGGGYNVGWTREGEWLEYTLEDVSAGTYNIAVRSASNSNKSGKSITLSIQGQVLGSVYPNNTGGWQTWETLNLSGVSISGGGNQVLRVEIGGGSFNLNHIAFIPSGSSDPTPVPNSPMGNPDIFAQNELLKYGVNFSGMEAPNEGDWSEPLRENDFKRGADIGVKSARIPIRWDSHLISGAPNYTIDPAWLDRVEEVVGWAKKYDMSAIVNVHHFDDLTSDPDGYDEVFFAIWKQIAEHFQNEPKEVFFELLNEPKDALNDPDRLNKLHNEVLPIIRATNPHRSILVGCKWSGYIGGITDLELPADDRDLIYTGHYYSPLEFTHQGAWWCCGFPTGTTWGTADDKQSVNNDFYWPVAWAKDSELGGNRPLHLGEYGALGRTQDGSPAAPYESRVEYVDHLTKYCVDNNLSWSHWEWKGNYGIYNEFTDVFELEVAQAMLQDGFTGNSTNQLFNIAVTEPKEFTGLNQNFPNPFSEITMISYSLEEDADVKLEIFDMLGRKVRTLIEANQSKGAHSVEWNTLDDEGLSLPYGLYIYEIKIESNRGSFSDSKKMMLVE